jgi:hypothetical protein
MAAIGAPRTTKFQIGTAEIRVGPLSMANKLTQAHSVGLLDSVTIEVSQDSVDLEGGFPRSPVDTAIIRRVGMVTGTLREYSRRNLRLMLGEGVGSTEPSDVSSLVVSDVAAGATAVTVTTGDGAEFTAGDLVVIYPEGNPAAVSVCLIASISGNVLTLSANTPTLHAYNGTLAAPAIKIYVAQQVAVGGVAETNYFAAQVIQTERKTGRPVGFNIWKSAIASGMNMATNAEDFASTELQFKMLEPSAAEYGVGGPLAHLASIIPSHPQGLLFYGADDA